MRLAEGVEWSLHACSVLAALPPDKRMPAAALAELFEVPAPYLAKQLQALARAEVLDAGGGRKGGYRLARPADQITMLDVVVAVDADEPAFTCTEIRRRGPVRLPASAFVRPCGIAARMRAADEAWRAELRRHTVADLLGAATENVPPDAVERLLTWFQEVIR
jgi:Rrf2 family protein